VTKFRWVLLLALILTGLWAREASAQGRPGPAKLMAAQREAMSRLAIMDGVWRGAASISMGPDGKHEITQTERVGSFLDGSVKVVEGRGYEADGTVSFNALGIISYDPESKSYTMHSYAQGNVGDFVLTPTDDGYSWEIPAGPMKIKYTATIKDGTWIETGDRVLPGKEPVRFLEMKLERVGDTDWPSAGAVKPQ